MEALNDKYWVKMIKLKPGLRSFFAARVFFFSLGSQNRSAQNRFTDVKINLD